MGFVELVVLSMPASSESCMVKETLCVCLGGRFQLSSTISLGEPLPLYVEEVAVVLPMLVDPELKTTDELVLSTSQPCMIMPSGFCMARLALK